MDKLIRNLLYFLAFLLPLQARWIFRPGEISGGYLEYVTMSLYLTDIVLLALLALIFINLRKTKEQIEVSSIWVVLAGLELFVFVSLLVAPDKGLAVFYYLRFLLGLGLFWAMTKTSFKKIRLFFAFLLGVAVQAMIGVWQFINQSDFANKYLGIASHDPTSPGTSVVEVLGEDGFWQRWLRAYGGLDHPNMLGGLLVVAILFILLFVVTGNKKNKKIERQDADTSINIDLPFWAIAGVALFFITLFFTFSRASWIGLIIGVSGMLALSVIKKDLTAQLKILKTIFIMGIIAVPLLYSYGDLVEARILGKGRIEEKSINERVSQSGEAIQIIRENLFLGVGVGNYTKALSEVVKDKPSWYYQPVHNTFLLIWAEIGLIGFLFFLGVLQLLFARYIRNFQNNEIYRLPILISLIFLLMFDHWWWSLHFGVLLFWFVIGVLYVSNDKPWAFKEISDKIE